MDFELELELLWLSVIELLDVDSELRLELEVLTSDCELADEVEDEGMVSDDELVEALTDDADDV